MARALRFALIVAVCAVSAAAAHAQPTPGELPPEIAAGLQVPPPGVDEPAIILVQGTGLPVPPNRELAPPQNSGPLTPRTTDTGTGKDKTPFTAGWNNGFLLRSTDEKFSLRITGQVQSDYRDFTNPGDTTDVDGFLIKRARFGLEATLFQFYEFRFMPDFGQGQTRLKDAFANVRYWEEFQFSAGKFKQPFSYEQLTQDRFTPFMERSLIDQLVPARDIGVMLHGQNVFDGLFDYGFSTYNGVRDGDADTNGAKDVAGRVAVRPFAWWDDSILKRLQFGISGDFGNQSEAMNPSTLRTPSGIPFFQFNRTVMADGRRTRWSPEVAYFVGSFGFAAQYFRMDQRVRPTPLGPASALSINVPFEGYYIKATYLLTGEERTGYSQMIAPKHPFDPRWHSGKFGIGAWEVIGRVSRLRVGDEVFAPGAARLADPSVTSNGATEMTLGFNWYLNRWVRTQFNWERSWYDRGVRLGPGPQGIIHGNDALMTRFHVMF